MSDDISQEDLAEQWANSLETGEEPAADPFEAAQAATPAAPAAAPAAAAAAPAAAAAAPAAASSDENLAAEWANSLVEDEEAQKKEEIQKTLHAGASSAVFKDMTEIAKAPTTEHRRDMDFILDIPLDVSAELGRARLLINELLQLGQGSVVELNKLAGEPLEVFVNGKLVARGEAVVINEKFGVRLTDIISPMERVKQLA